MSLTHRPEYRRRRRKSLRVLVWLTLVLSSTVMCWLLVVVEFWLTSRPDGGQTSRKQVCDVTTLPPAIQLHCRMYEQNIITGSLCDPLCYHGHVCDATGTYGSAHKEVMVTQCHDFCHPGNSIKAVLKHDVFAASEKGYREEYRTFSGSPDKSDSAWKSELKHLLGRHLPHAQFSGTFLQVMLTEYMRLSHQTSARAVFNSLTLLFRQKEYVLFRAYQHKGVFPKVYGACGPLYLVEYCDPILTRGKEHDGALLMSHTVLPHTYDHLRRVEESKQEMELSSRPIAFTESFRSTDKLKMTTENANILQYMYNRLFKTAQHGNTERISLVVEDSNTRNATQFRAAGDQSVSGDNFKLLKFEELSAKIADQLIPNNSGQRPLHGHTWSDRAGAAIKILQFQKHLEQKDTFPEGVRLCDPKLEHFAVSRGDGRLRLIDADLVLFRLNSTSQSGAAALQLDSCADHKDCSDVMCRGWCREETGTCLLQQLNNNLQGICENVFLRPSPVFGVLMAGIPGPAYQDVTRTLCLCARGITSLTAGIPWQRPAAAVTETLLDVLLASVGDGEGSDGDHSLPYDGGGGDSAEFLFDDCETIVSPITLT